MLTFYSALTPSTRVGLVKYGPQSASPTNCDKVVVSTLLSFNPLTRSAC